MNHSLYRPMLWIALAISSAALFWLTAASVGANPADDPFAPAACTALNVGQTITATIAIPGEADCFTVEVAQDDHLRLRVVRTLGDLAPLQEIVQPSGAPLCDTTAQELSCSTLEGGVHRILVRDYFGPRTGSYTLHLQRLTDPVGCRPLPFDQTPLAGSIAPPGEMDCYTFFGQSGSSVRLRVIRTADDLAPLHEIVQPDGASLCDTTAQELSCQLTVSGKHVVLVRDYFGPRMGDYQISLSCLSALCEATPTPCPTDTIPVGNGCATPTPTPTTPTPTPTTPSPTPTFTPVVTPAIHAVRPNQGRGDIANTINVYGANFQPNARASLNTAPLTTTVIYTGHLQALIPAGVAAGVYDVGVSNPDGGRATLPRGYTVIDPVENDDLFGLEYELWLNPPAPRTSRPAHLFMTVRRQGGKNTLNNVKVRFYHGDPAAGGAPLGEGIVPFLGARDFQTTSVVTWTPPLSGTVELFAVIDPDHAVAETYEENNTVHRTITILPPAPDETAPRVDSFMIHTGTVTSILPDIRLNTRASDPPPGSVTQLFFVEYAYYEASNQWSPVQLSGWKPYETARTDYPWRLLPNGGLKVLHAWAADAAGNISVRPFRQQINYLPPSQRVEYNQRQLARYTLNAGERLTARLKPISGDPDLYIWPPNYAAGRPPYVSNLRTGVDDVTFVAEVTGVYQVEVYGFSAADFELVVTITAGVSAAQTQGGEDPSKPKFGAPLLPNTSEPGDFVLPPAPTTPLASPALVSVFLPLIDR